MSQVIWPSFFINMADILSTNSMVAFGFRLSTAATKYFQVFQSSFWYPSHKFFIPCRGKTSYNDIIRGTDNNLFLVQIPVEWKWAKNRNTNKATLLRMVMGRSSCMNIQILPYSDGTVGRSQRTIFYAQRTPERRDTRRGEGDEGICWERIILSVF